MLARLLRSSYVYVVINTVVSLLAFGRNLLFMNSLGLAEVGQIALMQTIVMLVGFAQGGLISGTFILWAGGDVVLNRRMADVLFVGKAVLGVLLICGLAIVGPDVLAPIVNPETLLIGLAAGLATLASTWMNNALVADQKLRQSNLLNVVAVLMSLGLAILTLETNSLMLALGAIALQPLLVALGAMLLDTLARPRIVRPDPDTLRRMLAIGVRPFLGSLSLLLVYQIERWSIAGTMGPEALGRYFIVILYMTFFLLVPTALMNVNFPRASRALAAGETDSFRQIIRRHMAELAIYAGLALLIKLALLSLVLDTFLPNFTGTESLVYLAFLNGLAMLAQAPGTLVLYSVQDTRPVLTGGLLSLGSFCLALAAVWVTGFTLTGVLLARLLSAMVGAVYLLWQRHIALAKLDRGERSA